MYANITNRFPRHPNLLAWLALATALSITPFLIGACSDEPVGHTKTVNKTTVDTPDHKTTTTETHEKDTRIIR